MTNAEKQIAAHGLKGLLDSASDSKNTKAQNIFIAASLAMLAFSGAEAVRVIFRNDFGKKGVAMWRLYTCCVCFIVLGGISLYTNEGKLPGILLILFGTGFVRLGRHRILTAVNETESQGNPGSSRLFKSNYFQPFKEKFSLNKIVYVEEPGRMMMIGSTLLLVCFGYDFAIYQFSGNDFVMANTDILLAAPFWFCGISVWLEALSLGLFSHTPTQKAEAKVEKMNKGLDPTNSYNEVVID